MNGKYMKVNKWLGWMMMALGVISLLYGLLTFIIVQPEGKSANTLLGMFTGLDSASFWWGFAT